MVQNNLVLLILIFAFIANFGIDGYAITNETIFAGPCSIRISQDVGKPSPVMTYPGTHFMYRASNSAGLLTWNANAGVHLSCPGSNNYLTVNGRQEATAFCVSGTTFSVDGAQYQFNQLTCLRWPTHVNFASGTCLWGSTLVKTGFQISTGFVDLYDACHNTQQHHTYYTKFVLGRDAAGFQSGVDRPEWYPGNFFVGLDPTNLYRRATQRITFTSLLGSAQLAEQYIHLTNDYFLSKGHLVAKADFLHGCAQMATFWYTNAAPQWQTFNGNNWNALENDARSFAARINKDLDVYTGTYGRAQLNHINGHPVDLYLSTTLRMQAPRMFWKILYDPITQTGIAFVGLNNPYQTAAQAAAEVRCNDICSTVTWLTWYQRDVVRGYSFCCEVNDFRNNFPDVPQFPVIGILR